MSETYLRNLAKYLKILFNYVNVSSIEELCSNKICYDIKDPKICYIKLSLYVDDKKVKVSIFKDEIHFCTSEGFYKIKLGQFPKIFFKTPDDYYMGDSPKAYTMARTILEKISSCLE